MKADDNYKRDMAHGKQIFPGEEPPMLLRLQRDDARKEVAHLRKALVLLEDILDGKEVSTGTEPEDIQILVDKIMTLKRTKQ